MQCFERLFPCVLQALFAELKQGEAAEEASLSQFDALWAAVLGNPSTAVSRAKRIFVGNLKELKHQQA